MTILLTGGGTGGHITPLLAVAHELKTLHPDAKLIYIGERNGKFAHLTAAHPEIDEVHTIFAGKYRRYYGLSFWERLSDLRTVLLNLRDLIYMLIGLIQSVFLVRKLKPNAIFLKGGFVGVPVGLAAALWRVPFLTHDSDATPGLANRIVGRWARYHATGMPPEFYEYPKESMVYVGVVTGDKYVHVTSNLQRQYQEELGLPEGSDVVMITGGSLGAQRLNQVMVEIVPKMLVDHPSLYFIHQVGKGNGETYGDYEHPRLQVLEFLDGLYRYSGAADVVVTRAGATNLAEFGVQGKACVVVPNPLLTGGHQLQNAQLLVEKGAVVAIDEKTMEKDPEALRCAIEELLSDKQKSLELGRKLHETSKANAAQKLATLLLELAKIKK